MLEQLSDPQTLMSFLALAALEIVLGIDNIVFIAIMVERVEEGQRQLAYRLGLGAALLTRLILLFALSWILGLSATLFTVFAEEISGRDLVLILGGSFLMFKSCSEIFEKVESRHLKKKHEAGAKAANLRWILVQIMIIDIVFSLDSVITAVGMAKHLWVMVAAMIVAVLVMMLFAKSIGDFIGKHPSMQVLALSFLLLIGVLLVAEGFDQHVSKGYIYFAMAFSLLIELFNMRQRKTATGIDDVVSD